MSGVPPAPIPSHCKMAHMAITLLALLPGSSSPSPRESSYLANTSSSYLANASSSYLANASRSYLANASTSYLANASRPIATLWGVLENEPFPYILDVGANAGCRYFWAKSPVQLSLNPCVGMRRHSGGDDVRRWTNRWVKQELVLTGVPATVNWLAPRAFRAFVYSFLRRGRAHTAVNIVSAVYILHTLAR